MMGAMRQRAWPSPPTLGAALALLAASLVGSSLALAPRAGALDLLDDHRATGRRPESENHA